MARELIDHSGVQRMGKDTIGPATSEIRAADEAVLVESARSGDMNAFSRLVEKYQDRVLNTCWRISGRPEDAEDLAQETFLKAMESIASFRRQSGFYTWLFRIAVNVSISHRRRKGRLPRLSLHSGDGQGESENLSVTAAISRIEDPSARLTTLETQQRVQAELDSLDDDHRTIIVLRDIEGFDYRQIAEMLEVNEGTVKSRLHRARVALKDRLKAVI